MSAYAAQLQALVDGIVHRSSDLPSSLILRSRTDLFTPTARLAVYSDGYDVRLCAAVGADYPALTHYLGADAMDAALQHYVRAHPSRQWDLNLYPIGFSTFMRQWSADTAAHALADLESAIIDVFWRPDSTPLQPQLLAALTMDDLESYQFKPRTALKLLSHDVAANQYLTAYRARAMPEAIESAPEYLCIVRHQNEVRRLSMRASEYAVLALLFKGAAFGEALDQSQANLSEAGLTSLIARWLSDGVFGE